MKVIIDSMAWLPKNEIRDVDLILLKRKLTLIPKATSEYKNPEPIELFYETEDMVGLPREFYFLKKSLKNEEIDNTSLGYQLNEKISRIPIRDYQSKITDIVLEHFKSNYGCCFEAPTAWGKTIAGLHIARELGRSTLIIVHKGTLADQWIRRINGDPNETDPVLRKGFMPEAVVGKVGDGELKYRGCDFVIALVQSLYEKQLPPDFFTSFGTVLIDEVHRMGSDKWGRAVPRIKAKYRCGISATMRRKDDAENVFYYSIGPIVARGKGNVMVPDVYLIETGFRLIQTPQFNPDKLGRSGLLKILAGSIDRNKKIAVEIYKALVNGRKVLCTSDRIKQLEHLISLVEYVMKKNNRIFSIGRFYKGDTGITKAELEIEKRKDVVFGTYKLIEDGEDVRDLDTLFMASPLSDPEQVVGRILRVKEGKKPLVIDFTDNEILRCKGLACSRVRLYKRKGWRINEIKR